MRRGWVDRTLDELAFVGRGKSRHRPRNEPSLYGGEHPFVQTAEIHNSDLWITTYSQTYSDKGLAQSKMWEPGTICITNAGENTGDSAILGIHACFPDSVIAVIPEQEKADVFFLKYAIEQLKPRLRRVTRGATQDNLSVAKLISFKFPAPPVDEQRKIGSLLRAYGDLIENNRRRIQLLEQSARLLFKEWFVHLRFPGHEHVKVQDGVPEGWNSKQVKDLLAKVQRPRKIKKEEYLLDGPIPCVDQSQDFIGGYTDNKESVIDETLPVIVFGDHTRCLKFIDFPFASGADGTQLIVSNDEMVSQVYFYFALDAIDLSNYFYARHFKYLKDQYVLRPTDAILEQFTSFAQPLMAQVKCLREQNCQLAKARALLLPRLMNGEIAV